MRQFDFLGKTKYFVPVSLVLIAVSIIILLPGVRGLKMGIDFTGGMQFTVKFPEPVDTADVRAVLAGIDAGDVDLTQSIIQDVAGANTKTITTQLLNVEEDQRTIDRIEQSLRREFSVEGRNISRVLIGQQVSEELARKGWQAILLALVAILVYISWRFRLRYAIGAVAAIVHDVVIALGIFALFGVEVNLPTIAGFLTIVGGLLFIPNIGMYYGVHEWTGAHTNGVVDARFIAVVSTAVESPLQQVAMIPMLAWIANSAPAHLKATFFAVMASFTNLALSLGQLGTKYVNQIYEVTREVKDQATGEITTQADYSELGLLFITVAVVSVCLPLLAIFIVKRSPLRSA